jgi:hypothetical protein
MDRQDAICGRRNGATNTEALSEERAGELRRLMRVDAARLTVRIPSSLYVRLLRKTFEKGQLCIKFCLTYA